MTSQTSRRRVMLISADGMRPDLFDPELMPSFARVIREGVHLVDYHASYPTHSRVNITTIATGCLPGRHGIAANVFRVDGATSDGVIDTGNFRHIQALDAFTGGGAIQVPTLPEILAREGRRSQIVATSSDAAGLIWNRRSPESVFDLNQGVRRQGIEAVRRKLGPVPPESLPNRIPHVEYTARAVSEHYLDDPDLDFIGVWLSEPDHSLHQFGIGSPEVRDALRAADRAVGEILAGLERRGIREQFDLFLISDHGHSSVAVHRSLGEYLDEAIRERFPYLPPLPTASDFIYPNPDYPVPTIRDLTPLVEWLQDQPWCGAVFGGTPDISELPGVLPLAEVWGGVSGQRAPLLAVTPAWSHAANSFGVPGTVRGLTEHVALRSTHGSASPHDLHAFAVVSGPDVQPGRRSSIPAGAQDLTPTICQLLGVHAETRVDGRVLTEVMGASCTEALGSTGRVLSPRIAARDGIRPAMILHDVATSTYLHSAINGRSWVSSSEERAGRVAGPQDREVVNR